MTYHIKVKQHQELPKLLCAVVLLLLVSNAVFIYLAVKNAMPPVCELENDYLGRKVCALHLNQEGEIMR